MGELKKPDGTRMPRRPDAQFRPLRDQPQKKSHAVPLLMLGGAALVGLTALGRSHDVQRNRYDSLEECVHDYSTGQCELDNPVGTSGGGGGGLRYYGPWYRSDRGGGASDPGPGRFGPRAVEFGTRGGFGASGRVFARAS